MDNRKDTAIETVMEHLIEHGPAEIASVFARVFELAMQIERERFLGAGLYERTPGRQGYANGYKPKRIDTPAGTVEVAVPKTAGHAGEPFYPQSLERGRRSVRAVMLAVAEMYVKGVLTRDAEAVMRAFGKRHVWHSAQHARQLDTIAAWALNSKFLPICIAICRCPIGSGPNWLRLVHRRPRSSLRRAATATNRNGGRKPPADFLPIKTKRLGLT